MIISTIDQFGAFLGELDRRLAVDPRVVVDLETTGLDPFGLTDRRPEERHLGPARTCGVSIATDGQTGWYIPVRHETEEPQLPAGMLLGFTRILEVRHAQLINHNIKFDLKFLASDQALPDRKQIILHDTQLEAYVLNEERESYTLESLAAKELGIHSDWKRELHDEFKKKRLRRYSQFTVERLAQYAIEDATTTFLLHDHLNQLLRNPEKPWWGGDQLVAIYDHDIELLWVLFDMETRGIKVDRQRCAWLSEKLGTELLEVQGKLNQVVGPTMLPIEKRTLENHEAGCPKLEKRLAECTCPPIYGDFLIGSHPQMLRLFQERGWPVPRDQDSNNPTFADLVLMRQEFDDPAYKEFVQLVGRGRSLSKFKLTYYDAYLRLADENNYLHPQYNQHGTNTGRLSSSQPNFQNVPKTWASARHSVQKKAEEMVQSEVRTVILPRTPEHRFVAFDYSQQEIRMFLHYAEEPRMREIVMSTGIDIHTWAAIQMFGEETVGPKKLADGSENVDHTRYRHFAKTIVFGILYGMGKTKLARSMEIPQDRANEYWDRYMSLFPEIRTFMKQVAKRAKERQRIQYWSGRLRRMREYTPQELADGRIKTAVGYMKIWSGDTMDVHKALNSLIQGGCADLTRQAMVRCAKLLEGTQSYLVNQVHDDVLFELHESEFKQLVPQLKVALEDWPQFRVPFYVEMKAAPRPGASWAEAKGSGA